MTLINKHEDLRELLRRPASSSSTICLPESHRRVTLVIPTLNEPKHLVHVLPTIPDVVDGLIIVDGKSIDGTLEVVREFRPDAVIVPEQRHGKGHALRAVFEAARGDIIVTGRGMVGRTDSGELVRWTATELAGERGCSVCIMGESGRSAALAQFKKKFGTSPFGCGKLQLGRLPWTRADAARPSASRDSTMPDRRPSDMRRSIGRFRPGNER